MSNCLIITVLIAVFIGVNCQRITKAPSDKYAITTSTITFECVIENYSPETDSVEWCKNDFCTWGRSRETDDGRLSFKSLSRYFIVGNREKGEWNLRIENVSLSDQGEYKCTFTRRAEQVKNTIKLESNIAALKIMKTPEAPQLDKDSTIEMIIGQTERLTCTVYSGVPAPIVRWQTDDGLVLTKHSRFSQLKDGLTKNPVYVSQLDVTGAIELDGRQIICSVEHPTLDKILTKSVQVNLEYAPILSIKQVPQGDLIEGNTYKFTCESNSKPAISLLRVYLNDENKLSYETTEKTLTLIMDRTMNGKSVACEGENSIGKAKTNQTLTVYYPPKFIETPEEIIIVNGSSSLTLRCVVDSNPEVSVVWMRNNKDLIEMSNDLKLTNVNNGSTGEYSCKATNAYLANTISFSTSLIVTGAPSIIGDSKFSTELDKDVNIEFQVFSNPPFEGEPICKKLVGLTSLNEILVNSVASARTNIVLPLQISAKYKLNEVFDKDNKKMSSKFSVYIKAPTKSDLGVYVCSIGNSHGSSDFLFEVQPKDDSQNILIVVLVVTLSVLLVLIVLLVVSITVCRRRLTKGKLLKKSLPNVNDDTSSQQSGTSPNLSVSDWVPSSHHDDQSSDKSSSSQKHLLSHEHSMSTKTDSTTNIAVIVPNMYTPANYNCQYNAMNYDEQRKCLESLSLSSSYDAYNNYAKVPIYQPANIIYSKYQTNV